jgi:hypothetical protein
MRTAITGAASGDDDNANTYQFCEFANASEKCAAHLQVDFAVGFASKFSCFEGVEVFEGDEVAVFGQRVLYCPQGGRASQLLIASAHMRPLACFLFE